MRAMRRLTTLSLGILLCADTVGDPGIGRRDAWKRQPDVRRVLRAA